jgi:hypothetical protein
MSTAWRETLRLPAQWSVVVSIWGGKHGGGPSHRRDGLLVAMGMLRGQECCSVFWNRPGAIGMLSAPYPARLSPGLVQNIEALFASVVIK